MSSETRIILIVFGIILVFFSAFFSAAETAYSAINPVKIESEYKKGSRRAKLIKKHYKTFGWTFSTILIANNLVNITASSLVTYLFADLLGASSIITLISTFVVTPIIVIFGEIIPKILAKKFPYQYVGKIAYAMEFFNILFSPITYPLSKVALQSKITNTENEIKGILKLAKREGILDKNEAILAEKALDLDNKKVRNVMTKKDKIVWVKHDATIIEAKNLINKTGHSRLLVKDRKGFMGVLILKDIMFKKDDQLITNHIVSLIKISRSIILTKALESLRINKAHIAAVTETASSKKVVGIITMEDIIEELVGEIYDEHDKSEPVRQVSHGKYIAFGTVTMNQLSKILDYKFPDAKGNNIKQWIQKRINRKIKKSLRYEFKDKFIFKILKNKNGQETIIEIFRK